MNIYKFLNFSFLFISLFCCKIFSEIPFSDYDVGLFRQHIAKNGLIDEWKNKHGTQWHAIAIIAEASSWQPGSDLGSLKGYITDQMLDVNTFASRLISAILLGRGFEKGLVNAQLQTKEEDLYSNSVKKLSEKFIFNRKIEIFDLHSAQPVTEFAGHAEIINELFVFKNGKSVIIEFPSKAESISSFLGRDGDTAKQKIVIDYFAAHEPIDIMDDNTFKKIFERLSPQSKDVFLDNIRNEELKNFSNHN